MHEWNRTLSVSVRKHAKTDSIVSVTAPSMLAVLAVSMKMIMDTRNSPFRGMMIMNSRAGRRLFTTRILTPTHIMTTWYLQQ